MAHSCDEVKVEIISAVSFLLRPWGRKINSTNSKTLVGRCRDRSQRALPLTCPNVNNLPKNTKMKIKSKNDKMKK